MFRIAFTVAALSLFAIPTVAEDKKPTVNLTGSLDDRNLTKEAPANGVVASQKAWEKLVKAWDIKNPPKVDFDKEILLVGTTVGSGLNISPKIDDKGDLKITSISTADLRPGFRYLIKSVSREGVKTINGKELPKE